MNSCKVFLVITLISLIPSTVLGANYYVRAGATGSGSGTDWNNAMTALPSTLVRGSTYYIAAGTYPSYKVDDPVSGTNYIKILKATKENSGSVTGWNDSYAGQAIFGFPFGVITSYVVFDGIVGSLSSNPNDYGFKIATSSNCSLTENQMIGIPPIGYSTLNLSNVTISHVAMTNCGEIENTNQMCIYSNPASASNMTITHNYFYNSSSNILIRKWSNSEISSNYFAGNWSATWAHGQQFSPGNTSNITLSSNIFKNSDVFVVGAHNESGGNYDWKVLNNIIDGGILSGCIVNAESAESDSVVRWTVAHNTFMNVDCGGYGAFFVGKLTNITNDRSYFFNNLFYNSNHIRVTNVYTGSVSDALIHDFNAYYDCADSSITTESNIQLSSGNPFIPTGDYKLKAPTAAGNSNLGINYSLDFRNLERVNWDRGAYEFSEFDLPVDLKVLHYTK